MGYTRGKLYADKLPEPNPLAYVVTLILAPPIILLGVACAAATACTEKCLGLLEKPREKESALKALTLAHLFGNK